MTFPLQQKLFNFLSDFSSLTFFFNSFNFSFLIIHLFPLWLFPANSCHLNWIFWIHTELESAYVRIELGSNPPLFKALNFVYLGKVSKTLYDNFSTRTLYHFQLKKPTLHLQQARRQEGKK